MLDACIAGIVFWRLGALAASALSRFGIGV